MYTLLLIGCILALTLCPLLLDAVLTRRETRRMNRLAPVRRSQLALATQHLQ